VVVLVVVVVCVDGALWPTAALGASMTESAAESERARESASLLFVRIFGVGWVSNLLAAADVVLAATSARSGVNGGGHGVKSCPAGVTRTVQKKNEQERKSMIKNDILHKQQSSFCLVSNRLKSTSNRVNYSIIVMICASSLRDYCGHLAEGF
jgi:hypothetical protein